MKKIKLRFRKKENGMKAQYKPSIPSSPFGIPEDVYSKFQQIYLVLTGSSYPSGIVNDDSIQTLLVAIENYVGITSTFSVGTFSIPENVRDRIRALHTRIGGGSYSQKSADPETLYKILVDSVFPSYIYGHWKLNESSGIAASDSSWHLRNGTLVNNPIWIVGKLSNAIRFSGLIPVQYVDLGNIASFERTNSFSIEFWMSTIQIGGPNHIIARMENAGDFRGWAIRSFNGSLEFTLSSVFNAPGQSLLRIRTNNFYNDGSWKHVVITYDGSSSPTGTIVYVNGVVQVCTTIVNNLTSTIINAVNLRFGSRDGSGFRYIGDLDEVVIYNKVLSLSEVLYRYNSGSGRDNYER